MTKSFKDFLNKDIKHDGFKVYARDAYDTYTNIRIIFKSKRTHLFSKLKPLQHNELVAAYKELVPAMEVHHPGVIDKLLQKELLIQYGFDIDESGNVYCD